MTQDILDKNMRQDKTTTMIRNNNRRHYLHSLFLLLVMMVMGATGAWAEGGHEGTYFIANAGGYSNAAGDNYYMVPAKDPQQPDYHDAYYSANYKLTKGDPEKPFITTYKTGRDNNSIWQIISSGDGYYYIKHWQTGKYLIYEPPYSDLTKRKSVHLQTIANPSGNAYKFDIITSGTGVNIRPISLTSNERFLNPAGNNADRYYGEGGDRNSQGMVGVWKETTGNSVWHLEETVTPPTFTVNADGSVQITSEEGYEMRYTTDGSTTPTASSTQYSSAITQTDLQTMTAIQAIAIRMSDSKASNVVTLPLQTYTYHIVNRSGAIAIKYEVKQPEGKRLTQYADIPATISSPYLSGEDVTFYTFSEAYTSADQLNDENKITETPDANANIYVTYTTAHLSEKYLKLRGARAFNIKDGGDYLYDNGGTLAQESTEANKTTSNHLWKFIGGDPYAVQIKNFGTGNNLAFSTPRTLTIGSTTFILAGTTSNDENITLMTATGTGTPDYTTKAVSAYSVSSNVNYWIIDKSNKKLINEAITSTESELKLPDEWTSPLVSAYHYYTRSDFTVSDGTYTLNDPAPDEITSPFDVGDGGDIYVTYDVGNEIDITGGKNYMLKFLYGEDFNQEDGVDGVSTTATKAVYPYNNGDFNLYVYGQEQWDTQLANGASTRTRWLWRIVSTGANADPYHVVIKSNQNQTVKDKKNGEDYNFPGNTYLRTYKPDGYESVVTGVSYENVEYNTLYPNKMPTSMVNGQPTEYMILGTSISSMKLKTVNPVDDGDGNSSNDVRRIVDSFEQYWKNNPTCRDILNEESQGVGSQAVDYELSAGQKAILTAKGWHTYQTWAYSAPWSDTSTGGKTLANGNHWYQTITMGTGDNAGIFTVEQVDLVPQVILLDQHGWEIVRIPMYNNFGTNSQTVNTAGLSKYDSPMVKTNSYHWYPTAVKTTGYHQYTISDPEPQIQIYENSVNPNNNNKVEWHVVNNVSYTSNSLAATPEDNVSGYSAQDKKYKTDFYVTYEVEDVYTRTYSGATTAEGTSASAYLLKQNGNYATTTNGTTITTTGEPASMESIPEDMQWYLRPNFNIDREMGYKYLGETGATNDALSKDDTEAAYVENGKNGFDPYNVQIQSVKYPLRYFTANTSGAALNAGEWTGTSTAVNLQNVSSKQTAAGYDQTTLNITNATFMVVKDANGNMRLMPRFDHDHVVSSFTAFAASTTAAETADNEGTQPLTLMPRIIPKATEIHSSDEITDMDGHYILASDFTFASGFTSLGTSAKPFRGIIDGQLHTISNPPAPLVAFAEGATIKNVILDDVNISSGISLIVSGANKTAIGAIACVATGTTRIYNCGILATGSTVKTNKDGYTEITTCSSSVGGTADYVGGLVGYLNGEARVINCYSYANITDGTTVGGIVGYNNVKTTSSSLKTMVMNCMYYGNIKGGSDKAPIYNGEIITNRGDNSGVGNYNYFYSEAPYAKNREINTANCALMAEGRFLQRFEFFRHLVNSHRELAGWWATGNYSKDEMAKWVLEPSQIGTTTPYPILKPAGYYPSVVNIDAENATTQTERNKGGKLGTLTVNIQMGTGGAVYGPPTGAEIITPQLTLNITDKDPEHFNFNYYKVQLPYYNDVGTKNYNGNRVVTGWKIVSITGGTPGTFTASDNWGGYNFADRNCTNKDLYGTNGSNRIFNQGAYWDVPEGVTAITIEPYWARCVYLADPNADKVYNTAMETGYDVPNVGGRTIFTNGSSYSIAGENQVVYTSIGNAISSSALYVDYTDTERNNHSVYDYAVVLVGNYHHYYAKSAMEASKSKPYTITSIDLDGDNEPDYSYILRFNDRAETHPVRADFINIPGLGMAQKSTGGTGSYNFGILIPKGWYESTNTSLLRFTQFEYEHSSRSATDAIIVQGGVMEQWVSYNQKGRSNNIPYIHVGGNVWFKEFHTGCHQDKNQTSGNNRFQPTKHSPISVTGGDFDEFYLTGLYVANAGLDNYADNAECYINGGRFGTVCGAAMEGIGKADGADNTGNITWLIQNADIKEFYAGGLNAAKPVTGNLSTTIVDSYVDIFCGGPKFGDMSSGKIVTTTATGCTFGTFFGAGYGGNSYSRYAPSNKNSVTNIEWNTWVNQQYKQEYNATYGGVSTQFSYQFIPMSDNKTNVARIFVDFVKFSLATTRNVTSTLTNCTITGNFYGGGSLGKVVGPVSSTLTNCTVKGNVFGAGFSAQLPNVEVDNIGFRTEPYYYTDFGTYRTGEKGETTTYTWDHGSSISIDKGNQILYTTENLDKSNLGSVQGNVTLTIETEAGKTTTIGTEGNSNTGNVFGGGEESYVTNKTENNTVTIHNVTVNIKGPGSTNILGNVFGGGDKGEVEGSTKVNIEIED